MFGAPSNTSPFGAPAPAQPFGAAPSTPFGSPAPAFGAPAPAFGAAPAPSGFGAPTPAFGAPAPSAFGAAPAPSAFGTAPATSVFGAPAPAFGAPAPSAFGAAPTPGLFGAPAPAPAAGGFGAAPASGGFGMKPAGGLFGAAPTPAPSTSMFGAPAPATGGLFGAPATAPAGGLFGAPAPAAPAFGSPAPAFGASSASTFGAPATSPFGVPAAQSTATGTASVSFQPTSKQDGTTNITLYSITAMPQFENKSFEELRLEDYMAGNKGSQGQQQQPAGFGGFGAAQQPAPATGLFGAPSAAPTGGGLFGTPAPATGGGLFGGAPATAPAPAFGGFGAPTPAPAFGAQPAPAPGLFGAPAAAPKPGGLFGSPAPAPAFGGFGSTTPAPAFGAAPAPATGGLFGTPAAAQPAPSGGLFGAPAPAAGGLFGATAAAPKPGGLFGSPAPAVGGLFGAPTPAPAAGGLFGAPAAPAPAIGGGLFGAPAAPTTPAAGGGLFGAAATPAPAAGGLFGAPAPAPAGGLFGAPTAAPVGGLFGSIPSVMAPQPVSAAPAAPTPSADVLLAQQLATVENQKKQLELTEAWRGNPPSGSKVIPSSLYDNPERGWESYTTQSSALMSYRAVPRSAAKIRPRGFTPSKQSPISAQALKSGVSSSSVSPILSPNRFIGSATKSLIIKPGSLTPKPKTRLLLTNGISSENKDSSVANLENGRFESPRTLQYPTQDLTTTPGTKKLVGTASPHNDSPSVNGNASPAHDFYKQVVGSPDATDVSRTTTPPRAMDQQIPTLTKTGYIVYPSIQDLSSMSEADLAAVSDFKVERPGYGSVEWDGAVDVRGVDLDSTVVIESKNVSVYDDAELNGSKPKRGSKLNRPAVITMYGIHPKSGAESTAEAKEKFSKKIEKSTKKMGAELVSFDVDSGIWRFRVGHFSRYGLDDDDSEDESEDAIDTPSLASIEESEKNELGGASKFRAPTHEDESTSGSACTDETSTSEQIEVVDDEEMEILRDGDDAYALMTEQLVEYADALELQPFESQIEEKLLFPNEADSTGTDETIEQQFARTTPEFPAPGLGICRKLANQCGFSQPSSSNFDYGLRMRRSFRVGWLPNGSFLHLKPSSEGKQILVQSKPKISNEPSNPVQLFKTHQNHSKPLKTDSTAPLYTLPIEDKSTVLDYIGSSLSYSLKSATRNVVSSSFALLACLYGNDEVTHGYVSSSRRLEAVSSWLKGVVSEDVAKDINLAKLKGDSYGSVFAALSGGDMPKASSLALDCECSRLSLMLASSGVMSQPLFASQLQMWKETKAQEHVPNGILRLFSLASGSVAIEQSIFKADSNSYTIDWRRRFGMYLWSCPIQEDTTVSSIVEQYRVDVSTGVAPAPTPLYACVDSSIMRTHNCVLYEILGHHANPETTRLANIVAPATHTKFNHDFSVSFHLAASLTALTNTSLTLNEENLIIDAISSQLIMNGSWEWAVYATLSSIGNNHLPKAVETSRMIRASNIILRFYTVSATNRARRSFLEKIGVPPEWFSAAIAYRSVSEGEVFTYVNNLLDFSIDEAVSAIENIIIPHYILGGKKSRDQLMQILQTVASGPDEIRDCWEGTRICKPIYEFLCLSNGMEDLSDLSTNDIEILIDGAATLYKTLSQYRNVCKEEAPLAKVPFNVTLIPRHVYLAEVCRMLSDIRLRLLSLKSGNSVEIKKCSSELVFALNAEGLFGTREAPTDSGYILRGMCGFTTA